MTRTASDAQTAAATNRTAINNLLGKNASTAIENFNEIITFLNGVTDSGQPCGVALGYRRAYHRKRQKIREQGYSISDLQYKTELLEAGFKVEDNGYNLNALTEAGFYFLEGPTDEILIVYRYAGPNAVGKPTTYHFVQYLFYRRRLEIPQR